MPVDLTELRVEQVDEAVAFARDRGAKVQPEAVVWSLSLLGRAEGELVAAALYHHERNEPVLEIVLDPAVTDAEATAKLLVDKALLKIQARRVHKCVIRVRAEQGEALLFPHATWYGDAA